MKNLWTDELGRSIATISGFYGVISDIWSSMKIGTEITEWLKTDAGKKEAEAAIRLVGAKYFEAQQAIQIGITKPVIKKYFRNIYKDEVLELDETDGTKTFANSSDVFNNGIDPDFKKLGFDKPGKSAGKMLVKVVEIIERGTLVQFLGAMLGTFLRDGVTLDERKRFIEEHREDLHNLCMKNMDQVINFAQKFPGKINRNGYGTLFLLEDEDTSDFFVVDLRVASGGPLGARVYRFEHDAVRNPAYCERIVVPK